MKKLMQLFRANAQTAPRTPISAQVEGGDATLYVYDIIDADWGISAAEVSRAIAGLDAGATLHLRINSPGGDVFEARAIASALRGFGGKVVAHIDGLAASAATTIAVAADEVEIADGSFFMIHNAWTFAMGDKSAMTETAALLDKIDGAICADYCKRTSKAEADVVAWMNAETWFTAQEAVDNGFADRLAPEAKTRNATRQWNLSAYDNAPEQPAPEPDYAAQRDRNARRLRLLRID